jgi:hypothetical protein
MKCLFITIACILAASRAMGWSPGIATPAAITDLKVDVTNRNDVISFYQNIYTASKYYSHVIQWSGDIYQCNEGTLSPAFIDLMRRRVNYYRALVGVPANIVMNDNSTIVTSDKFFPDAGPTTTKALAAQQAAQILALDFNARLTHEPDDGFSCFSEVGGNGCYFGNIARGVYGPQAINEYMREDEFNEQAGHRRWLTYNRASNFATGDVPYPSNYSNAYRAANSIYISQRPEELRDADSHFIAWPPAGYCPWDHVTEYFSLCYPGGDFQQATISVKKNGVEQEVDRIVRDQGYGNNGIVWRVHSVYPDKNINEETIYDVTVSNMGGDAPPSYSYQIHFINPNHLPTPPTLSGANTTAAGNSVQFTIGKVDIAEEYQLEVGKKSPWPENTVEGAEDDTSLFLIPGPVTGPGYDIRSNRLYYRGEKSLHVAFTALGQYEQWIEFDRVFLPKASASISYFRRLNYMTSNSVFSVQYCINNDGRWKDIPGTSIAGASIPDNTAQETDAEFKPQGPFTLPEETINQPTKIRLFIKRSENAEFFTNEIYSSGAFIDNVTFANMDWLRDRKLILYPATADTVSFNSNDVGLNDTLNGKYSLRILPRVGSLWMTASPITEVTVLNNPPTLDAIESPITIAEDANTVNVPLTGISPGASELQNLTITATSSNPGLIPNPTVNYIDPSTTGLLSLTPLPNQFGSTTITVTVNDGQSSNNTVVRTFVVNVTAVEEPPSVSAIADITINEDSTSHAIPFFIADTDTNLELLVLSGESSDESFLPSDSIVISGTGGNRTVTVRPAANRWGSVEVSVLVSDETQVTRETFTVTVLPVNDAPTLDVISNHSINEDAPQQLIPLAGLSAGPFESGAITVKVSSSNTSVIPHPVIQLNSSDYNGALLVKPVSNMSGSATITVTVNDVMDTSQQITRIFIINVNAVNDAPTVSPIAAQTINEDTATKAIAFTIGDIDSPLASLTVSRDTSDANIVPLSGIVLSGSGANRTVTVKPALNRTGIVSISINVTDGLSETTQTLLLTVAEINDLPTLNPLTNLTILEDAAQQILPLSGLSSGPFESDTLSVTAISSNTNVIPHPVVEYNGQDANGLLRFQPLPNASGVVTITVTADDGHALNGKVIRTLKITVTAVNDLPVITAIADQTTNEDTPITAIAVTVGDVETAATSLKLTCASSNIALIPIKGVVFGGVGTNRTITITPAAHQFGTAELRITVSDGKSTAVSTFRINVLSVNDAPTLAAIANPAAINEDSTQKTIKLSGIGRGAINEAQMLTITASSSNPSLIPDPTILYTSPAATGSLLFTPAPNAFGTAVITVTVDDGDTSNNSFSRSFTVTVNSVNDVPTISLIPSVIMVKNTTSPSIPWVVGDVETETSSLIITAATSNAKLLPITGIVLSGTGNERTVTLTPAMDQTGTANVTITVKDGLATSTRVIAVKVNPLNLAPTISTVAPQSIIQDHSSSALPFTIGDPEGLIDLLTVTAVSDNSHVLPQEGIVIGGTGTQRSLTLTPAAGVTGTAKVTLSVNDGELSTTSQFTLTVQASP